MAIPQSPGRVWPSLAWMVAVLLLAGAPVRQASARSLGVRRLQQISQCPLSPKEHCDFYLEGFETELPVLSLDGEADAAAGAPLLDAVSNQYAQALETDGGSFLCPHPGASANGEFYFATTDANTLRFHNHAGTKSRYENACFFLYFPKVQVQGDDDALLTLEDGDANQLTYPEARRCLVFATGPKGYPAGSTCYGR